MGDSGLLRAAAFLAACAALGTLLGYVAVLLLLGSPGGLAAPLGPSARDATDMVGDLESWLRAEGH